MTLGLILVGLLTAGCIWFINLNFERYQAVARGGSLLGAVLLLAMFVYSIYFVKGADYAWWLIWALSFGMTIVWLLACGFTIGVAVILSAGTYWVVTTWKNTDFKEFWANVRLDFKNGIMNLKSWFDDEE